MRILLVILALSLVSCTKYKGCVRCEHVTKQQIEGSYFEVSRETKEYCTKKEKDSIRYGVKSITYDYVYDSTGRTSYIIENYCEIF
jgi:hypothetical protein